MPKGDNAGAKGKLDQQFIDALETVVNENILYATDAELCDCVNELLPESRRISYETFGKWKAGETQTSNELYPIFLPLLKKALLKEKARLLKLLEKDPSGWQRFAWILERKFDDWNIKNKTAVEMSGGLDLNVNEARNKLAKAVGAITNTTAEGEVGSDFGPENSSHT